MKRVLLKFPHGLGDTVQLTVVLRHLVKHRPDWQVDVRCGQGKHTALLGLCHRVYHDGEPEQPGPYEATLDLHWFENYNHYADRPNSKITNCLNEVFGLDWDASLGQYQIKQSPKAKSAAADYLRGIGALMVGKKFNTVVLHYEGNTSPHKKNLKHFQAKALCDLIIAAGKIPVVLDWDKRSPLPDQKTIFCPRPGKPDLWGSFGSGDAEMIACLIQQSEAFIGIDSGPGKVASATTTPALICWVGHHPMQFHDPAPNTMHLIPDNWKTLSPCQHANVADWFEKHYAFMTYASDGLLAQAKSWLLGVLGKPEVWSTAAEDSAIPFVLPQGIGDTLWALTKIRSIAKDKPIDVILTGSLGKEIDRRSLPFLKRFPFIRSVQLLDVPIHLEEACEKRNDAKGRYNYLPDGERGGFHYLMPNGALERGVDLEDWLPDMQIDWNVMDTFDWSGTEKGTNLAKSVSPFVAFYLGPESGHCDEGHNYGWLWEPKHWVQLAKHLAERGMQIAVVGAPYDRSFWERYVKPGVQEAGMVWHDFIGQLEIGETLAFLRQAKALVSYQCGLGITSHYLGVPVAMWWRPDGNSCHPRWLVSFDERMASCWTNPSIVAEGKYLPLIYRRETVGDIICEIDKRGWLK